MNTRWGLRLGLLSGLLSTTSGVPEVPAGGWPPVEALALFATLWASSPYPCKDEDKSRKVARSERTEMTKDQILTHSPPPLLLPSSSSLG